MTSGIAESERPQSVRCLVCQKEIHASEERHEVHWRGGHYVVCCPSCAAKFRASPDIFVTEP